MGRKLGQGKVKVLKPSSFGRSIHEQTANKLSDWGLNSLESSIYVEKSSPDEDELTHQESQPPSYRKNHPFSNLHPSCSATPKVGDGSPVVNERRRFLKPD